MADIQAVDTYIKHHFGPECVRRTKMALQGEASKLIVNVYFKVNLLHVVRL